MKFFMLKISSNAIQPILKGLVTLDNNYGLLKKERPPNQVFTQQQQGNLCYATQRQQQQQQQQQTPELPKSNRNSSDR